MRVEISSNAPSITTKELEAFTALVMSKELIVSRLALPVASKNSVIPETLVCL